MRGSSQFHSLTACREFPVIDGYQRASERLLPVKGVGGRPVFALLLGRLRPLALFAILVRATSVYCAAMEGKYRQSQRTFRWERENCPGIAGIRARQLWNRYNLRPLEKAANTAKSL
jgi:hypothetical protein